VHVVVRTHELESTAERAQSIVYSDLVRLLVVRFENLTQRWGEGFSLSGLLGGVKSLLTSDVSEERSALMFWIRTRKK